VDDHKKLAVGKHTIYARARIDQTTSDTAASRFTVRPDAEVQWQVVHRNGATSADGWQPATGLEDWSFTFDTGDYRPGSKTLAVRVVRHSVELARDTVRVRFG
jgi:hypothetical protein